MSRNTPRIVKVYDKNNKMIYKGSLNKAIPVLGVSRQHVYDVINGVSKGLSQDSPAHYFTVDDVLYKKHFREQIEYIEGYEFMVKGVPVVITKIDKKDDKYYYTFNGVFTSWTRERKPDFFTIWRMAERGLSR